MEAHRVAHELPIARALHTLNAVEAKSAPPTLYVEGDARLLSAGLRVSIIGSRNATVEAMVTAAQVAAVIVKLGGVVVSGLAKGVDTAAHLGAIQAGGRTIAVLGNPLSRFYPAENRELQLELMRDHLVVSQFAENSSVGKAGFVARNRTMALLSHATVIIAATENSGTRHQAWEAIRLGREVFLHRTLFRQGITWATKMFEEYNARLLDEPSELEDDPMLNPRAISSWERDAATASA